MRLCNGCSDETHCNWKTDLINHPIQYLPITSNRAFQFVYYSALLESVLALSLYFTLLWASACGQPPWHYPVKIPLKLGKSFLLHDGTKAALNHDASSTIIRQWDDVFMLVYDNVFFFCHMQCCGFLFIFVTLMKIGARFLTDFLVTVLLWPWSCFVSPHSNNIKLQQNHPAAKQQKKMGEKYLADVITVCWLTANDVLWPDLLVV